MLSWYHTQNVFQNSFLSMIMFLIYFGSILKKYISFLGARFGIMKTPFGAME